MKNYSKYFLKLTFAFGIMFFLFQLKSYGSDPIEGKVVDAKNNKPIANAHINILGKNIGTTSDINGNFSISLPDKYNNEKLCIYTKGYQPKMYKVSDFKKNNTTNTSMDVSEPQEEYLFEMEPVSSPIINEDSPKLNRYNIEAGWIY